DDIPSGVRGRISDRDGYSGNHRAAGVANHAADAGLSLSDCGQDAQKDNAKHARKSAHSSSVDGIVDWKFGPSLPKEGSRQQTSLRRVVGSFESRGRKSGSEPNLPGRIKSDQ